MNLLISALQLSTKRSQHLRIVFELLQRDAIAVVPVLHLLAVGCFRRPRCITLFLIVKCFHHQQVHTSEISCLGFYFRFDGEVVEGRVRDVDCLSPTWENIGQIFEQNDSVFF